MSLQTLTPHRAARLLLTAARNVGTLRALGDLPGHEFHGNQWTEGGTVFHGTAKENLDTILRDGIKSGAGWRSTSGEHEGKVFVASELKSAGVYAESASGQPNGVVLEVQVPPGSSLAATGLSGGRFLTIDHVKPEWIKSVYARKPITKRGQKIEWKKIRSLASGGSTVYIVVFLGPDEPRAAAKRESAIHRAADAHVAKLSVVFRYAFARGRQALGTPPNADRASKAIEQALYKTLRPTLLACMKAGGEVALGGLRTLGDYEGHPFYGNQWTSGSGPMSDEKTGVHTKAAAERMMAYLEKETGLKFALHGSLAKGADSSSNDIDLSVVDPTKGMSASERDAYEEKMSDEVHKAEDAVRDRVDSGEITEQQAMEELYGEAPDGVTLAMDKIGFKPTKSMGWMGINVTRFHNEKTKHTIELWAPDGGDQGSSESGPPTMRSRDLSMRAAGDLPGHEFHGNQWTSGAGSTTEEFPEWNRDDVTDARVAERVKEHASEVKELKRLIKENKYDPDTVKTARGELARLKQANPSYRGKRYEVLLPNGDRFTLKESERENAAALAKQGGGKIYDHVLGRVRFLSQFRTLKPPLKKKLGLFSLEFDIKNARAARWALEHVAWLIDGISRTTRERIQEAVARAQIEGDLDQQYEDILAAVGDEDRANVIARTESMTAANAGQREGWAQAVDEGLLPADARVEWIGTSAMCAEVCEPLDGKTRPIDGEYEDENGGGGPPAHPNCRCTEGIGA